MHRSLEMQRCGGEVCFVAPTFQEQAMYLFRPDQVLERLKSRSHNMGASAENGRAPPTHTSVHLHTSDTHHCTYDSYDICKLDDIDWC